MKKRALGRTGIEISELGFGTWGLGGIYYGEVDDEQGIDAIRAYLEAGGNHLDSAFTYHKSEAVIGKAIAEYDRDKLVLASKSFAGSLQRDTLGELRGQLEISLRDLGTEYLDLYMIHAAPLDPEHLNELLDKYEKLKEEGKIRAIGVSIPGPQVTDESVERARISIRSGRIDFMQVAYSVARQKLGQVFEEAKEQGIGIVCRWVLESGLIAGKYPIGHEFEWPDIRHIYRRRERDALLQVGQELRELLPKEYDHPVQLAAAFALADPAVSGILMGGVTPEQVRRNTLIDGLPRLSEDLVRAIKDRYEARNDEFNPTAPFRGVPSVRE